MWVGLDTETTGLDLRHGCKPFLVTMTTDDGDSLYWEWDVDPLTRQPYIPQKDLDEIQALIVAAELLILQNTGFDYQALKTIYGEDLIWDWSKVRDTLFAAHLLNSNKPKDLTTLALTECGIDISVYDNNLKKYCNAARREARKLFPEWRIANKGLPEMPSAKDSVWKADMWLLRVLANEQKLEEEHPYWTAVSEYANTDSAATLFIYKSQLEQMKERDLYDIYMERIKVLPVACKMQDVGITLSQQRLSELTTLYKEESDKASKICKAIAKRMDFDLELPKSGNNKSLTEFAFDTLKLPVVKKTKNGNPSFDKTVMEHYQANLPSGPQRRFVVNLGNKRKRDTALSYMEGYERFWKALSHTHWYRLHPQLNPTGTDTLRWSCRNPNEQNISKKEGFNLRYCFGPAPGREWWSLDANNIELRIPAYEAGEDEMVALFERPDEPPFFGSNHLLVFSILHPDKWEKYGAEVKKKYASTWYQWTKNGNFAVQYGAVEESGTADRAYHVQGAQRKIKERFKNITKLNDSLIEFANKYGYVETMPDKTVNPNRGYPLLCTKSQWGSILPTVPLNYHVQGTAMWWMGKAMVRCQAYLDELNQSKPESKQYHMIAQVHDEIVLDFPKVPGNIRKIRKIKQLMEMGSEDIGVPIPVGVEYHPHNWAEGEVVGNL